MTGNNRFVFVACSWNMSATVGRMLHSIAGQSYDNWRVFITDDVSDPTHQIKQHETVTHFKRLVNDPPLLLGQEQPRITLVENSEKRWETANVLDGICECDDDDIVCRIDCDDWLIDLDALAILNEYYTQHDLDCAWSMHRWGFSDRNISADLPVGADPYTHPWVTSHLKTFRARLLNGVNDQNFRGQDGEYIKRCGDQAVYLPVLKQSKKRMFIPRPLYHYHIDEQGGAVYQTEDAKFQRDEALFLRKRGFVV